MKHYSLAFGSLGIERETLRTNPDATLAMTAHPAALGSAYTHPNITTDYAEALPEIVTDPKHTPDEAYQQLLQLHQFCAQNIGQELLWPASMPCILPKNSDDITIGYYGNSNGAKMRRLYRKGLAVRYGKEMQMIAGIHFNYSPPQALWQQLAEADNETLNQAYINRRYMGALRAINSQAWLINYLYGASPAVHDSFIPAKNMLHPFPGEHTLGWKNATSLRMSELGYQNKVQFVISFNDLDTYIRDLAYAVTTPAPRFEHLGLYAQDGSRQQISTHILQIANEYYTAARPKQPIQNNELPGIALKARGIAYIELRLPDCNPEDPCGISLTQLYNFETFMLWAILNPDPIHNHCIRNENDHNRLRAACCGLSENFSIKHNGRDISARRQAKNILDQMQIIAEQLDNERGNDHAINALTILKEELKSGETLPHRVQKDLTHQSFIDYAQTCQAQHLEILQTPLPEHIQEKLTAQAVASIKKQEEIEATTQENFETYLYNHFLPLQRILFNY